MAETYAPTTPCRHGHNLRYSKNRECVECTKIKTLRYRVAHRERVLGIFRNYRTEHRVRRCAESAAYRATHPEKHRATRAKTRAKHREKIRAYGAAYAKRNAQRCAAHSATRRARLRGASGRGLTPSVWQYILNASLGLCAYCNERKPLTIEHIDPLKLSGLHDPENIGAACKPCNSAKGDTSLLVWLATRIR